MNAKTSGPKRPSRNAKGNAATGTNAANPATADDKPAPERKSKRARSGRKGSAAQPHINWELVEKLIRRFEQQPADYPKIDRFVSLKEMGDITGWHRTTILKAEGLGHIPRRLKLPNGQTAFLFSEVRDWIASLERAPLPNAYKSQVTEADFLK